MTDIRSKAMEPDLGGVGLLGLLGELGNLNTLLDRACRAHLREQGLEIEHDSGFLVVPLGEDDNGDHLTRSMWQSAGGLDEVRSTGLSLLAFLTRRWLSTGECLIYWTSIPGETASAIH